MKNSLNIIVFIFALAFFLFPDFAHSNENKLLSTPVSATASTVSENRTLSSAGKISSHNEPKDFFDEFEKEYEDPSGYVADPLAPWNRIVFRINDKLYFWALKPLARGYKAVTPRLLRIGAKNFFQNMTVPVRLVNCILQAKWQAAETELARFLFNSTVGVLGFGNPAQKHPEFDVNSEDMGQTFGVYGIGNGLYLVWPFIGPSTLRDSFGKAGDWFLNPFSYIDSTEASLGITGYKIINDTSFRIGDYESFKEASVEPYEAMRDAYIQHRKKKLEE
jgi:phospholipid-binding lipoprotein MlaA